MTPSPTEPVPLTGPDLHSFLTLLEFALRPDEHAAELGPRPLPACLTCRNRPTKVVPTRPETMDVSSGLSGFTEEIPVGPTVLTLTPCGHAFLIDHDDLVRGTKYARNAVYGNPEAQSVQDAARTSASEAAGVLVNDLGFRTVGEDGPAHVQPLKPKLAPRQRTVSISWADLFRGLLHRRVTLTVQDTRKDTA